MMKHIPSGLLPLLGLGLVLAACTSSNIKSEWSCLIDQPEGCLDIPVADDMAMDDMAAAGGAPRAVIEVRRTPASSRWISAGEDDPASAPSPAEPSVANEDEPIDLTAALSTPEADVDAEDGNQGAEASSGAAHGAMHETASRRVLTASDPLFGLRIPERLAEVWLGPFEDEEGNYHPATRMVIIVRPAGWRLP